MYKNGNITDMKFWRRIGEGLSSFLANGGYGMHNRYGFYAGDMFIPFPQETGATMEPEQMLGRSVLGQAFTEEAPLEESIRPERQRMHAAELRPRVMKTWMVAREAERVDLTAARAAVAQGIIDIFPALSDHLDSDESNRHVSLAELMKQAQIEGATLQAITDTYIHANQEPQ